MQATDIEKYQNWTVMIYSEPGKGKTSMIKSLSGRTVVLSVDRMYQVLGGLDNITILTFDHKKPNDGLADFYRYVLKHAANIDNIVIDNLSTYQKIWLNAQAVETNSGMPEIKDYGIINRILFDLIVNLKQLNKNILILAHEKKVEVTRESGAVYTQFQPDVRNLDAIMGIVALVGRLVTVHNQEAKKEERLIVLQPTQTTRAKDQLIGNIRTIPQMDLFPTLQK